jgi:hypothetical protein
MTLFTPNFMEISQLVKQQLRARARVWSLQHEPQEKKSGEERTVVRFVLRRCPVLALSQLQIKSLITLVLSSVSN